MRGPSPIAIRLRSGAGNDYLNLILMVISLAAAFALPFELFLFACAVLGPLHYLTEICWLKEKNRNSHGRCAAARSFGSAGWREPQGGADSYPLGFYALFFLSVTQVFLEFPLNHRSWIGIAREVRAWWSGA